MSVMIRDFDITPKQPAPSAAASSNTASGGSDKSPFVQQREAAQLHKRLRDRHMRVRAY